MKVYALFSINNDYNQPENNLCRLWTHQPTFHDIKAYFKKVRPYEDEMNPKLIGDLVRGKYEHVRIEHTDYRIEKVKVIKNE